MASLSDIVDEYRERNIALAVETQTRATERAKLLSGGSERQLLEQQIRMLLSNLQHQSPGFSGPADEKVIHYLSKNGQPGSQPNTARRPSSAQSSARRSARSAPDALESLTTHLNAYEVDAILDELRSLLEEEEASLMEEVEFLMHLFEEEDQDRKRIEDSNSTSVPSTSELREFGAKLEKQWLTHERILQSPEVPTGNDRSTLRPKVRSCSHLDAHKSFCVGRDSTS